MNEEYSRVTLTIDDPKCPGPVRLQVRVNTPLLKDGFILGAAFDNFKKILSDKPHDHPDWHKNHDRIS